MKGKGVENETGGGEQKVPGVIFILADTGEKLLLKCLALISFRSDIIDFNEMFMV